MCNCSNIPYQVCDKCQCSATSICEFDPKAIEIQLLREASSVEALNKFVDAVGEAVKEASDVVRGTKLDNGKAPIGLIESKWLEGVAGVLAYGEKKYGRFNWKKGIETSRTYDAAMRHLLKWNDGVDLDEESGHSHLLHSAVNLMMLYITLQDNKEMDNRYKK